MLLFSCIFSFLMISFYYKKRLTSNGTYTFDLESFAENVKPGTVEIGSRDN